jgi:hypothetical protein
LILRGFLLLAPNIVVALELTALSPTVLWITIGLEVGNSP